MSETVPVEIVRDGVVVATVGLHVPLRLELSEALRLAERLFGSAPTFDLGAGLRIADAIRSAPLDIDEDEEFQRAAAAAHDLDLQRANLRARAEAMDADSLRAWLTHIDPGDPTGTGGVVGEIILGRLSELEAGAQPSVAAGPDAGELRLRILEYERERAELVAAADAGDDDARVRAGELQVELIELRTRLGETVNRRVGQ